MTDPTNHDPRHQISKVIDDVCPLLPNSVCSKLKHAVLDLWAYLIQESPSLPHELEKERHTYHESRKALQAAVEVSHSLNDELRAEHRTELDGLRSEIADRDSQIEALRARHRDSDR
ncbi:MAG: hypothetical protein F4Z87_07270 [Gammaproteobacteria bacterium]|nr:hypothetical protein [Gammaproteobacteria bacterium]